MSKTRLIEIGSRLRQLRLDAGLSQAQAAAQIGVSDKTVSSWETGARDPGSVRVVDLALMYGTSTDFILVGTHMVPDDLRALYQRTGRTPGATQS